MRETREEVDVEKFRMDHGKRSIGSGQEETIGYSWDGLVIGNPDAPECLCKRVHSLDTNTTRYFVKFSMTGPTAGTAVDPNEETDMKRRGDWTANGRFAFRPVNKLCFDLYLQFVKTGNKNYLHQAMRETN